MKLPLEYRWLKAHNFNGFTPWHLIESKKSEWLRKEYQLETGNVIFPFAKRQDNDVIAGFEILNGNITSNVLTVHLTWSSKNEKNGFPITKLSKNVFDWMKTVVIPATEAWMSEEDLEDLKNNN